MTWRLVFTAHAHRDAKKLAAAGLEHKVQELLDILAENPFQTPPHFEKLAGDHHSADVYSRRINVHERLVYQVIDEERVVKVLRMWTHYE